MLGNWIERQQSLPDGLVVVDEKLGSILKKIQSLDSQDLQELEAFVNYLTDGSECLEEQGNRKAAKMYDFMTGGMPLAV